MSVPYHQIMRERAHTGMEALNLIERARASCRTSATSAQAVQLLGAINALFWHHVNRRNAHQAEAIAQATHQALGPLLLTPRQARQLQDLCARSDASWSFARVALSEDGLGRPESMLMALDLRDMHSERDRLEPVLQHELWPAAMRLHPNTRLGRQLLQQCVDQTLAALDSDQFKPLRAQLNAGEIIDATLLSKVAQHVREAAWRVCDQLLEQHGVLHMSAAALVAARRREQAAAAEHARHDAGRERSAMRA